MIRERCLLLGAPGVGKTYQAVKIAQYVGEELKKKVLVLDLEDKFEAMVIGMLGEIPKWMTLKVAVETNEQPQWLAFKEAISKADVKEDDWIIVDRIDLAWEAVMRWYSQYKYGQELAERLAEKAKAMKKASMFTPRFDQGDWQPINEQYASNIMKILYGFRCNVVMTAGIKGLDDNDSRFDILGALGVKPRGQKELGHQPNTLLLLYQKRVGKEVVWRITTGKDLIGRSYFDDEDLFDLSIQYLVAKANLT